MKKVKTAKHINQSTELLNIDTWHLEENIPLWWVNWVSWEINWKPLGPSEEWRKNGCLRDFYSVLSGGIVGLVYIDSFTYNSQLPTPENRCVILQWRNSRTRQPWNRTETLLIPNRTNFPSISFSLLTIFPTNFHTYTLKSLYNWAIIIFLLRSSDDLTCFAFGYHSPKCFQCFCQKWQYTPAKTKLNHTQIPIKTAFKNTALLCSRAHTQSVECHNFWVPRLSCQMKCQFCWPTHAQYIKMHNKNTTAKIHEKYQRWKSLCCPGSWLLGAMWNFDVSLAAIDKGDLKEKNDFSPFVQKRQIDSITRSENQLITPKWFP